MTKDTIYSSYKPVEAYLQLVSPSAVALAIQPIDTLITRLFASFYPAAPVVMDLAADLTEGASAVLWLSACPHTVRQVIVADSETSAGWRAGLTESAPIIGLDETFLKVQPPDAVAALRRPATALRGVQPPLFTSVAIAPQADESPIRALDRLTHSADAEVVFVFMHGQHADHTWLEALHHFSADSTAWRLTALRDRSPFFTFSHLAVLYRRENTAVEAVLERIAALYQGNAQFIDLVRVNLDLMLTNNQLEKRLKEAQTSLSDLKNAHPKAAQRAIPGLPEPNSRLLRLPFRAARGIYHGLFPLRLRLRLRELRVKIIGW
jgi:hypothetical protein